MRPYLDDYFDTLSSRRRERAASLLEEALVGKEQLDAIAARLVTTTASFDSLVLRKDQQDTLIQSENLALNLRDLTLRIRDLYEVSNLVGLLLNSHAAVLGAEIKAIEDEILAMEKMARNFGFLLADAQSYDFAHLETFSNNIGRATDLLAVPDRAGKPFGPEDEAFVRIDEGVLTLPESLGSAHGLSARVKKSNVGGFVVAGTDVSNLLNPTRTSGWSQKIATAGPITSSLSSNTSGGAQALLEFTLSQPAPCSEIKLIPFAELPVEVISVTIQRESNEQSTKQELLDAPVLLDRPLTLHFSLSTVSRFEVLVRQGVFVRSVGSETNEETQYLQDIREINKERKGNSTTHGESRSFQIRTLERAVQSKALSLRNDSFHSSGLPRTDLRPDVSPENPDRPRARIMKRAIQDRTSIPEKVAETNNPDNTTPVAPLETPPPAADKYPYRYDLGLHYIGIGVDSPKFKGCFVSSALPAPTDIGEVRLKARVDNYLEPQASSASKQLTSVEFSVTNVADPSDESDWIPILPAGDQSVVGERLFFSLNGVGFLRFPARAGQGVRVYRNGDLVQDFTEVRGSPGETIGISVPVTIIGPNDIFTCDYIPLGDASVVSFAPRGFLNVPLVSAFSPDGAGEAFRTTGERNTVTLSRQPYVDPLRVSSDTYSPVTVVLDSGLIAENVTDYSTPGSSPAASQILMEEDQDLHYTHMGTTLQFNTSVYEPFRVFYQYLQNNVRYRVVLRCNSSDIVSPQVDDVHLKAKTRVSDPRRR